MYRITINLLMNFGIPTQSKALAYVIYMGLTWVETVIRNPNTGRHVTARALVDRDATLTVLPRRIAEELQLPVIGEGG
jgi:hypothetical protein